MKQLPFFLIILILLCAFGCGSKQSKQLCSYTTADSLLVKSFYADMQGINSEEKARFIADALAELDSTYYIEFTSKINGYSVKAEVKSICACSGGYIGNAILLFTNDSITRTVFHPMFFLTDSIFNGMHTRRLNYVDYKIGNSDYYNSNQLGQFSDVPFAFFDVDFDGNKELILQHPFIGQRFRSAYAPLKESLSGANSFEEDYIYTPIDSFIMKSDEYAYYPILDDQTEFDYKNKEIIVSMSAGYAGSEKLYYKVNNRTPLLCRKEVYYCGYDTLAKRITYTSHDTITQYFNNAKEHRIW